MSLTPQRASRSTRWSPSCACQVKSPGETRGDWKCEGGSPAPAGAGDGFADTDAPPAPRACASSPGRRILTLVSKSGKSFFRTIESSFQRFKSPVSSRRRRCRGGGRLPRSPCKWRFSEEHSSATILGPVNHRPRKPRLCVSQQAGAPAGSGTRPRARRPRREGGSWSRTGAQLAARPGRASCGRAGGSVSSAERHLPASRPERTGAESARPRGRGTHTQEVGGSRLGSGQWAPCSGGEERRGVSRAPRSPGRSPTRHSGSGQGRGLPQLSSGKGLSSNSSPAHTSRTHTFTEHAHRMHARARYAQARARSRHTPHGRARSRHTPHTPPCLPFSTHPTPRTPLGLLHTQACCLPRTPQPRSSAKPAPCYF